MNILVLNSILFTPKEDGKLPDVNSIKDTMIYGMCMGFLENGHSVTLCAAEEYKPLNKEDYPFEIKFFPSSLKFFFPPTLLPFSIKLFRFLKKRGKEFDLIISSEVFQFSSLFVSILYSKKTIIWHELALHQKKFNSIPSKLWYNVVVPIFFKNVRIVPRSKSAFEFISLYAKNVSSTCVEHGVDINKFSYSVDKENYFVVVSQLIPRKNIESILRKYAEYLKETSSDIRLKIIGRGVLEDSLKIMCEDLGVAQFVDFLGFLNHFDLNKVVMFSKALLIDTLQDNNLVSIPEAIVSGTPVLSNKVPTNSDVVLEHKLGIVEDEWIWRDMKEIDLNNAEYVANCVRYREKLSNVYLSDLLISQLI